MEGFFVVLSHKKKIQTENMNPWVIERTARVYFEDDTNPELLRRLDGTQMNFQQVERERKSLMIASHPFRWQVRLGLFEKQGSLIFVQSHRCLSI